MKAITYTKYGPPDVLAFGQAEKPIPTDDEVLVEVFAASIDYADWAFLRGKPFIVRVMGSGLLRPRNSILGADIAGRTEAVGSNVVEYRPGDAVFGDISDSGWGGFAEYACAKPADLAPMPVNLTLEQAAAVPQASITALQGLRDAGGIRPGCRVLVVGASGGIGSFAVQIAKSHGAEVTGVCSTKNVDMVRSIKADRVVDYTRENFADDGERYDLIFSVAGYRSIFDYKRALAPHGVYVMVGGAGAQLSEVMLLGPWLSMFGTKKMTNLASKPSKSDLIYIKELIEAESLVPVIDRSFPLNEVASAIRYYGERHARGKVVISIKNDGAVS
jgi:NADPH:quinone reductase-like Zn-dependent oxidoreductase